MPLAAFPHCCPPAVAPENATSVDCWIDFAARELDVDGLEFSSEFLPAQARELCRLRDKAERAGLCIPIMSHSADLAIPEHGPRKAELARLRRVIEATAQLGGEFCRVSSGRRRPEVPQRDWLRLLAESITCLLPHAERHGVCLILEDLSHEDPWGQPEFAPPADTLLELLEAIPSHRFFGVNYDPTNTEIGGDDPLGLLEAIKTRVVTVHASNRVLERGAPKDFRRPELSWLAEDGAIFGHGSGGDSRIDYDRIFTILGSVGFHGWISIDDGDDDPLIGREQLRESTAFLRTKMWEYGLP